MATAQAESDGVAVVNERDDGRSDETPGTSSEKPLENNAEQKPVCLIVLGMAGSGKTTFVQVNTIMFFLHLYSCRSRLLSSDWRVAHNRACAVLSGRCALLINAGRDVDPLALARCH